MKHSPYSILLKALGTVVLAGGFVWMVGRVPFLPEQPIEPNGNPVSTDSVYSLQNLNLHSGAMRLAPLESLATEQPPVTAGLEPSLGLFKARFAADDAGGSGFATEEHRVAGQCAGAGYRYIHEACPGCQIINDRTPADPPTMLMWTDPKSPQGSVRTVSTDCISVGPDGVPVVGTLEFGDGVADLSAKSNDVAVGIVPLLPGSSRVAAVEIGGWLATFDQVARPSTAMQDMASTLLRRGWREASQSEPGYQPVFEGERVFTNSQNAFCVVSLSRQGDTYQLLTVVSSHM